MGLIKYKLISGALPITVKLLGSSLSDNVHTSFGDYEFSGVDSGEYQLKFIDNDGCEATEDINPCENCPTGYDPVGDKCIKYEEEPPTYTTPVYTILKKQRNNAYGVYGVLIFDTFNLNGTGVYERFPAIAAPYNTYWLNRPYPSGANYGPLNRNAVWANVTKNNQDIAFSFCIDIALSKQYYVGMGSDNYSKVYINGELVIDQDVTALMSMLGTSDRGVPFKYWYIYPVELPAGKNVIEMTGHNVESVAAVGAEVYDATKQDLMNATCDADLDGKILFKTLSLVGQDLNYEYTSENGYHGYSCSEGYALDTCDGTAKCIKREEADCLPEPICFGYLYNWYATNDSRKLTSSDDWNVPALLELENLADYVGDVNSSNGSTLYSNPGKLKSLFWDPTHNGITNETGFSAVQSGWRASSDFQGLNSTFFMWGSNSDPIEVLNLSSAPEAYDNISIQHNFTLQSKYYGMSIRLVKDATGVTDGTTTTYTGNDGKTYNAIAINELYWTTENLEETQYRNGDAIPNVTDATDWSNLTTGALCLYNNDNSNACKTPLPEEDKKPFITEWEIPSGNFSLPLTSSGTYDFNINWGDGSAVENITDYADRTHTYTSTGTYTITINGTLTEWRINQMPSIKDLLTKVIHWGDIGITNISGGFYNCSNLISIPNGSITGMDTISNFSSTFFGCSSLTSIPTGLFDYNTEVSNYGFSSTFGGCSSITTIPSGLFDNNTKVAISGFTGTFGECSSITSIPSGLFDNNTLVSSDGFDSTFYGCSSITSIPSGLFDNNTKVSDWGFNATFSRCSSLTSIPSGLFDNNIEISEAGFNSTFFECSSLTSIPAGLFDNNIEVSDKGFYNTFNGCNNLTAIPSGLFDYNTKVSTYGFYGTFWKCNSLTSIPSELFDNNTKVSEYGFYSTFRECNNITNIPTGLFDYNTEVSESGFRDTFYGCSSITSIPSGLFDNNTKVSDWGFNGTFSGCSSITSIPTGLFDYNIKVAASGFRHTFYECNNIADIPAGLFDNNTEVSSDGFYKTFQGCSSIASIPSGLFDYNIKVYDRSFYGTFQGCSNITTIPSGLFDKNTEVSYQGFIATFDGCSSITSVPSGLFDYNTKVSDSGFNSTFSGCNSITSIPSGLFDNNTEVSGGGFYSTFYGCSSLTSIPTGLFRFNTKTDSFVQTFRGCTNLQLNKEIFYQVGEENTRFLNKSVSFSWCFERTSFSGTQGEAPELWNCDFGTGTPTKTLCYSGAGNNTTSLSNYGDIPNDWK